MRDARDFKNGTLKVKTYEPTPGGSGPVVTYGRVPEKFVRIIQRTNEQLPEHVKQATREHQRTTNLHNTQQSYEVDIGITTKSLGFFLHKDGRTGINLTEFHPSGRGKPNPNKYNIQNTQQHEKGHGDDSAGRFREKSDKPTWQHAVQTFAQTATQNTKLTKQEAFVLKHLKGYPYKKIGQKKYMQKSAQFTMKKLRNMARALPK